MSTSPSPFFGSTASASGWSCFGKTAALLVGSGGSSAPRFFDASTVCSRAWCGHSRLSARHVGTSHLSSL
eukprot:15049658-Alexandrium_andersonii.AAC.1